METFSLSGSGISGFDTLSVVPRLAELATLATGLFPSEEQLVARHKKAMQADMAYQVYLILCNYT